MRHIFHSFDTFSIYLFNKISKQILSSFTNMILAYFSIFLHASPSKANIKASEKFNKPKTHIPIISIYRAAPILIKAWTMIRKTCFSIFPFPSCNLMIQCCLIKNDKNGEGINNQLRMILLIGMKSNLTIYPIPPMIANPMAHEVAIFLNSTYHTTYPTHLASRKPRGIFGSPRRMILHPLQLLRSLYSSNQYKQ